MRWTIVLTAVLLPAAARAEMPSYDVDAHCRKVASHSGSPSQGLLAGCHRNEQLAYDMLKSSWDSLPESMRRHCEKVATFGGGSYGLLQGCISNEQAAARENAQFKFKR